MRSLKIRPHLRVVFVTDAIYLFQIIGAAKRSRGNNSSSHDGPDARHTSQFFFCRRVDVDPSEFGRFFRTRMRRIGKRLRRGTCHLQWLPGYGPSSGSPSLRFTLQLFQCLAFGRGTCDSWPPASAQTRKTARRCCGPSHLPCE